LPARRVLVVDDTHDAATMLARLLAALGQEVRVAYDGLAALAAVQEQKPHLVISDIAMPGMDGYSLAERLRARPEFNDVPLIALTGYGQQQDRLRALEAGFNYHLVKPITLNTLEEILSEITGAEAL
jgi:CheY-like chemotaxis protein